LWEYLLAPENERKPAVLNWTSGLARQLACIVEKHYKQMKKSKFIEYDKIFTTKPFMETPELQ